MRKPLIKIFILILIPILSFWGNSYSQEPDPQFEDQVTEAKRMAERIMPQVAKMRGLEWKNEVETGVYSGEMLHEMLKSEVEKMKEEYIKTSLLLYKLGLVEKGFDLYKATMGLYGAGIAGFYDPATKELNLIVRKNKGFQEIIQDLLMRFTMGVSQDEMVIAHELTHALDDQYFDLANLIDFETATSDMNFVRLAVTEGTAVSIQYDFLFQRQGTPSYDNPGLHGMLQKVPGGEVLPGQNAESEIPGMLVKQMLFPYSVGNRLVFEARKRDQGKWDTVNKMFKDLPDSSEQVLHPEKYLDTPRDVPVIIEQPDIPQIIQGNWAPVFQDTFGEFQFWIYIEDFFKGYRSAEVVAKGASEGWDGDTMALYQNGDGELILTWITAWDTEEDAIEFFKTYQLMLQRKYSDRKNPKSELNKIYSFEDSENTKVYLERRDKEIIILEGVPSESIDQVIAACYQSDRR